VQRRDQTRWLGPRAQHDKRALVGIKPHPARIKAQPGVQRSVGLRADNPRHFPLLHALDEMAHLVAAAGAQLQDHALGAREQAGDVGRLVR